MQNLVGNRIKTDEAFAKNKKMFEDMEVFLNHVE